MAGRIRSFMAASSTRKRRPSGLWCTWITRETSDTFTRGRMLPELDAGDLVAFMSAGAYGAVMSSEYNTRPLVPEVLVNGSDFAVVRPRPGYEEMLAREPLAPWL